MSSGFESGVSQKFEVSKTEKHQGPGGVSSTGESLKNIAQLNSYHNATSKQPTIRFSGTGSGLYPMPTAVQMISTMSVATTTPVSSAPILPKLTTVPAGPPAMALSGLERSQQQTAAAMSSAAVVTATASFQSLSAAQHQAISIIRPPAPMHAAPVPVGSVVGNIYTPQAPRVITTNTTKTITAAPSQRPALPQVNAIPRLTSASPLAGLVPAAAQTTTSQMALAPPQLLLASPHATVIQTNAVGMRNVVTQHSSLRPNTPPSSTKLPATASAAPTLLSGNIERAMADSYRLTHHQLASGVVPGSVTASISVASLAPAAPVASASTVQITIHQPKATLIPSGSGMVAASSDRLPYARLASSLPSVANLGTTIAAQNMSRLIIPQNASGVAGILPLQSAAAVSSVTIPRPVPVISTAGGGGAAMVHTATSSGGMRLPPQRNAGQHDYSRHEPSAANTGSVFDSLSKPLMGSTSVPVASSQPSVDSFAGRLAGNSSSAGGGGGISVTAVTTMVQGYLANEQLYAAAAAAVVPPLPSLGFISTSNGQQFLAQPHYARGQYRTAIFPSPPPNMSTFVPSTATRTALLVPALSAPPMPAAAVLYGQANQNGSEDAAVHGLPTVSSVIVSNTTAVLQQQASALPGVGSSSPRPSILRKRAVAEGGSGGSSVRRVLQVADLAAMTGGGSGFSMRAFEAAAAHARADSPKLPLTLLATVGDRVPASRRSSTDTATDPALSIDSLSPPSVKQEPMDALENGIVASLSGASTGIGILDVSPRKKPRKQLLSTVTDYKEEDYSTEEETETKGMHPICLLRQNCDLAQPERLGAAATASVVATLPPLPPSGSNAPEVDDDDAISWLSAKRPRLQLLETYKRSYPWKTQNNHFQRYSDVKPKEESRLTVSELSSRRGVAQSASGWRLYHVAAQLDEVSLAESALHDRLHDMQQALSTSTWQHRGSGTSVRHSVDTVATDTSKVSELAQACKQRCTVVQSQLKEAREAMLAILEHRQKIMDIIAKHHCKRPVKKKERT